MKHTISLLAINAGLRIAGTVPTAILAIAYTTTLRAIGGAGAGYKFAESGSLPAGFTFTDNSNGTCTLACTSPVGPGAYPITITVSDSDRNSTPVNFVLLVQALPLTLSGDAGDMRIGDSDTYTYIATGGYGGNSFALASGAFPPGWSLNSATGVVTRGPTTAGNYSWAVSVTDSASNVYTLADSCTIRYALPTLTGSFTSLGIIGVAYSSDIVIAGGNGAYSNPLCTSANLPAGLALSIVNVSGTYKLRLSGTPTTQVTASITVAVDSTEFGGATTTATHSQSVTEDPALTLSGSFATPSTVGAAYQSDLLLGGGDGTYSLHGGTGVSSGSVPPGSALSIVTVSGSKYLRLSGTLTGGGSASFTASVDSGDGQNVTSAQTVIVTASPIVVPSFSTTLYDGVAYSSAVTISGGSGTYSSSAVATGSLPTGLSLSLSGSTLTLAGTCNAGVSSTFTASVTDNASNTGTSASQTLTRKDQYFGSVVLLAKAKESNGSTTSTDVTGKTLTGTAATVTTAQALYGTGSFQFNSNPGSFFKTAVSSDFSFGSGSWSLEISTRPTLLTSTPYGGPPHLITITDGSGNHEIRVALDAGTGKLRAYIYDHSAYLWTPLSSSAVISVNAWNKGIQLNYDASTFTFRLFAGGTIVASFTAGSAYTLSSVSWFCILGYISLSGQGYLDGQQDEVRVTKGICRNTANYTPQADSFPES